MTTGLGTESGLGVRCAAGCPHSREPDVSVQVEQRTALCLRHFKTEVVFRVRQGNGWYPEE
jgi:hypothetical protein